MVKDTCIENAGIQTASVIRIIQPERWRFTKKNPVLLKVWTLILTVIKKKTNAKFSKQDDFAIDFALFMTLPNLKRFYNNEKSWHFIMEFDARLPQLRNAGQSSINQTELQIEWPSHDQKGIPLLVWIICSFTLHLFYL